MQGNLLFTRTAKVEGTSLTSTLVQCSNIKQVLLLLINAKPKVNGGLLDHTFVQMLNKTVSKCARCILYIKI